MSAARPASRALAALLLVLACAAGCAKVLERTPIEKQTFVLAPGRPDPVSGPRAGVLRVGVVHVTAPFQNRAVVLRTAEATYPSDYYNEFAAPPGTLLRGVLVEWLREGTHFAAVARGSEVPPDWMLETDLESLYADVRDPSAPQAALTIAVRLLDARAPVAKLVFEKRYATTEPAADPKAAAVVDAWNRALARILRELSADLDAATTRSAPTAPGR